MTKSHISNEKIRNEKLEMRNCGVRCADDFKRWELGVRSEELRCALRA